MEEVKPLTLPFSASFDPSNPLGFLEKVLDFIGKESNFLRKDTAEKEIIIAVTAAKERLSETEKKKKTVKESVKQGTLKMNKYGLQIKQSSSRPPLRTPSIFDEDEDNDVEKEISRQASKNLKEIEEKHKKALEEDPSAFAYDDFYDDMKQETVVPRLQDREERKPRYFQQLMKQAKRREKEHEIVYERKLAKQRAKSEYLYSDKEKFVTGAYKKKLEEQNKWLAEERLRELQEEKDDVTKKKDLSDFYFNIEKNVAFGARDIEGKAAERPEEQRKAEKLEELRKEETKEEKNTDSPAKEKFRKSVELQEAEQAASEKTELLRHSSINKAAKEAPKVTNHKRNSEDPIAAAKERFLARKKAKIEK